MQNKHRPFPEIPFGHFPGEKPNADNIRHASESTLLTEPYLEVLANTAAVVRKETASVLKKELSVLASFIVKHPTEMEYILDALDILQDTVSRQTDEPIKDEAAHPYNLQIFKQKLLEQFEREAIASFPPQHDLLQNVIIWYTEDNELSVNAEKILEGFFKKCSSPKLTIDFLHSLMECLVLAPDRAATKNFIIELFNFETKFFSETSPQARWYITESYSENDETFLKVQEIDTALELIVRSQEVRKVIAEKLGVIGTDPKSKKLIDEYRQKNPARFRAINNYFNRSKKMDDRSTVISAKNEFPYTIIQDSQSFLARWSRFRIVADINTNMVERGQGQFAAVNFLPNSPSKGTISFFKDIEQAQAALREHLNNFPDEKMGNDVADHTQVEYLETIQQLAPFELYNKEKNDQLARQNEQLKKELLDDTPYLLHPRGDKIRITDERAAKLGYTFIEFHVNPSNKHETIVRIGNGKGVFVMRLTKDLALTSYRENEVFISMDPLFLEHLVYTHLHALRCTDKVEQIGSEANTAKQSPFVGGRRPHRRRLPKKADGTYEQPSPEQIEIIWAKYGISIPRLNNKRREHGIEQPVTYVSHIDPKEDVSNLPPVESVAPHALDYLTNLMES